MIQIDIRKANQSSARASARRDVIDMLRTLDRDIGPELASALELLDVPLSHHFALVIGAESVSVARRLDLAADYRSNGVFRLASLVMRDRVLPGSFVTVIDTEGGTSVLVTTVERLRKLVVDESERRGVDSSVTDGGER